MSIRDLLTEEEARARAERVHDLHYDLDIQLQLGAATYRGETLLRFRLSGDGPLFLDLRGRTIERLEVNGRLLEPDWSNFRLRLPGDALGPSNLVRVVYENEYDHTGDGFHQFRDPEDGEEYLYTNFEPFESHRLFPNFDQPDIKATYSLTVTAPAAWTVLSNAPELSVEPANDGSVVHRFPTTAPFSSYLFALIAGPYHSFRDRHGANPLGFHCRRSLVRYVDIDELFAVTKQGLDFFSSFFDYPYPFGKYDQVFVPEFNAGAMENVACVTHSERMVFRDPPTENQRQSRAEVILHEMAHMWFGDLVTMRWWNDLWLNESFASYMAYLGLTEATRFRDAWQAFNAEMKNWAYRQDQLVTTHPIAGPVRDTDETFLNFDGITYGKGAAVLKQLVATIGRENFRAGMRRYFRRHAYGNTTLVHFLDALQEGSGRDLHGWARLWLETASLNTIRAEWAAEAGRLRELRLQQSAPPEHPVLRPHVLELAIGREDGGRIVVESLPSEISGSEAPVSAAAGMAAPLFVIPNHNDHAFAKVALDPRSLSYLRGHLERLEDPLLRQIVWQSLWHMVRDCQLTSPDYLSLARAKVPGEVQPRLLESILGHAQAVLSRFVPEGQRSSEAHTLSETAWQALLACADHDLQIIWTRALINLAVEPADIERLGRLADGGVAVPGLTVDQEMRWQIAARFSAYGLPGAAERVAAEKERDGSDRGQRAHLRCLVSVPDREVKAEAWRRFHEEGYGSLHLTAAAMGGFHWVVQRDLLEPYVEAFFERVPAVFEEQTSEFAQAYFRELFPAYRVEPGILDRSRRLLAEVDGRPHRLVRTLREANDDLERAIACRAFAAASLPA